MTGLETALIIVDSSSFDFSFQGDWRRLVGLETVWRYAYMNTSQNSRDRLGNFTLSFEGFDATLVGGGPMVAFSTYPPSTLTIDPGAADSQTMPVVGSDDPPSYLPWYKTPSLPYGNHRILMTHCVQVVLNYALVTIGPDTPLAGRQIFVDDSDAQILYSGAGWQRNNNPTVGFSVDISMPALNTSYEATQAGDSFTFTFLGSSATVYGLYSWTNVSSLVLQYELDGRATQESYSIQASNPLYRGKEPVHINVPFISYNDLSPISHQLKVTVMEISNTTFRFDYITYTPSFSTLASKSSPGNTTIFTPSPEPDQKSLQVKVIVGSVIGGLALLAIAVGALGWWNRLLNARTHNIPQGGSEGVGTAQEAPMSSSSTTIPSRSAEISPSIVSSQTIPPTPYPPEKTSVLVSSPRSQASFPYLETLPPMTVSAYPVEKRPIPIMPSNRTLTGSSQTSTRDDQRPVLSVTRSESVGSSTNLSTWGADTLYADSATVSSDTSADNKAAAGHHNSEGRLKLVTIHETPAEPPSYTSALSGLAPAD